MLSLSSPGVMSTILFHCRGALLSLFSSRFSWYCLGGLLSDRQLSALSVLSQSRSLRLSLLSSLLSLLSLLSQSLSLFLGLSSLFLLGRRLQSPSSLLFSFLLGLSSSFLGLSSSLLGSLLSRLGLSSLSSCLGRSYLPSLLGLSSLPGLSSLLSSALRLSLRVSLGLLSLLGLRGLSVSLCSTSEMLLELVEAMVTAFSRVTLPKRSISREMWSLTKRFTPFLMATTLSFWMRAAVSPLKKALAEAVSSATTASTMGIFLPSLVSISLTSADTIFTQTLYPLLACSISLTLINLGCANAIFSLIFVENNQQKDNSFNRSNAQAHQYTHSHLNFLLAAPLPPFC